MRSNAHFERSGVISVTAAAVMFLLIACPARAADILIVLSGEEAPYVAAKDAASKAMTAKGHTVRVAQLSELADDMPAAMKQKVDVYLAIGSKSATALHEHVKPPAMLFYCMVSDPDKAGLTQGAPASGISMDVPVDAQIKLMLDAVGKVKSIGMFYRSDMQASVAVMKEMEQAMPKGVRLYAIDVSKHSSMAAAIEEVLDQKVDIVWTAPDTTIYDTAVIRSLLLDSMRRKTPVFGFSVPFVKAGALLGVGIDPQTQGEDAAALITESLARSAAGSRSKVSRQTQGGHVSPASASRPAGDHVVEAPRYQTAVNLIVADRLSITLPVELVEKASRVFRPDEETP